MNRVVKFRVWDKQYKKMYYPTTNLFVDWDKYYGSKLLCEVAATDGSRALSDTDYEIMQFTGLKDKNGKDVYEGDIYVAERSYMPSRGYKKKTYPDRIKVTCIVEWSIYNAGWHGNEIGPIKEHQEADQNAPYHYYHTSLSGSQTSEVDWIEVIGNIHDNPELLTDQATVNNLESAEQDKAMEAEG
jgi:uncharacterized phage protein (TIGR01671 family)